MKKKRSKAKSTKIDPAFKKQFRAVAKEITRVKLRHSDTLQEVKKKFFDIMRKHGIKEGEWEPEHKSRITDNFEWTMCKELFLSRIVSYFIFNTGLLQEVPKDLQGYEE